MNKHKAVKEHLLTGNSITSWQAIKLYRATRLSAIIFNLKRAGMDIDSIPRREVNENGEIVRFTEYRLHSGGANG